MAKTRPPAFVLGILDVLDRVGPVEVKRLFGGWAYTHGGEMFAMVLADQLYFRVDDALRAALEAEGSFPFTYEKAGKVITVGKFLSAPDACLDEDDLLVDWACRAMAANPSKSPLA
ncbi:MAG: TfoX/Sxy family protein [Rhodospirillum sp.]|nr:TfoX/Sxy family protein [Rhodospirillum sp.]MCF8491317.1 TfoX/Sxy family protein [Rhodospirillum sp.]MCF8503120.1 TfoX/Sxy family protein [Rhodospirillum sp.]